MWSNKANNTWSGSSIQLYLAGSTCWGKMNTTAKEMVDQNAMWNVGTAGSSYGSNCAATDWLWPVLKYNISGWFISGDYQDSRNVLYITSKGMVSTITVVNETSTSASPTVYLKSTVTITGGSGDELNPYDLEMTS